MKLTNELAKKIGEALKVDFNKIKLEDFIKGIKVEEEHKDLIGNPKEFTIKDYVLFAKIAHRHLIESPKYYEGLDKMEKKLKTEQLQKLQRIISKLIKEDKEFKHKLKFEVSQNDTHYNDVYNKKLGKYKVDSPEQLKDEEKEAFYKEVDEELSSTKEKQNEMAFSSGRNKDDDLGYDSMMGQDSGGSGDTINNYDYKAKEAKVKAIGTKDENALDDRYNATKFQYENKNKKISISSISEKANVDKKIVKEVVKAVKALTEANWIQGAIKHPGKCTPMSNPECTGKARALAKRFKSGDIHADNEKKDESAVKLPDGSGFATMTVKSKDEKGKEVKTEVHPEGREKQVQALKKKFPEKSAYKIAWAQAEKEKSSSNPEGKPKKEETAKINPVVENEEVYEFTLAEAEAIIRQQIDEFVKKSGSGWKVFSHEGKPLSKEYPSKEKAVKRLGQIEFFKHNK